MSSFHQHDATAKTTGLSFRPVWRQLATSEKHEKNRNSSYFIIFLCIPTSYPPVPFWQKNTPVLAATTPQQGMSLERRERYCAQAPPGVGFEAAKSFGKKDINMASGPCKRRFEAKKYNYVF